MASEQERQRVASPRLCECGHSTPHSPAGQCVLRDCDCVEFRPAKAENPGEDMAACPRDTTTADSPPTPQFHRQPHYADLPIEPVDAIEAWALDYHLGTVIAYIARHKGKGGEEDLEKALQHLHRRVRGGWLE